MLEICPGSDSADNREAGTVGLIGNWVEYKLKITMTMIVHAHGTAYTRMVAII